MSDAAQKLSVVFRGEEESWNAFVRRIQEKDGEAIIILSTVDNHFLGDDEERRLFLAQIAKVRYRLRLATRSKEVAAAARKQGIHVFDRTGQLRKALEGHPQAAEALRFFSPSLWRQQWRSHLQKIGLLSVPKVRIWTLIGLSALLFLFVVFRLLPSAEIRVWPRRDIVTQTSNVIFALSGATANLPSHTRVLPLVPINVEATQNFTFTDISPQFIGTDAQTTMTLFNQADTEYELRKGTRLANQAGMVFRLSYSVVVPPHGKASAAAKADHLDLYGKVIGSRGNLPAGVHWDVIALSPAEQKLVYAQNRTPGQGGITSFRNVLEQKDLDAATRLLKEKLLESAKQMVETQQQQMNASQPGADIQLLAKDDVIKQTYTGFVLPVASIGQQVSSIPVSGKLLYTVPAYDAHQVLQTFGKDFDLHIEEGKRLIPGTLQLDPQRVIIIQYADDFSWLKATVDLTGTEEYVLDPFTPIGLRFGKKVRESTAGTTTDDALRVIRNFPEVERSEIRIWPPWNARLPAIPSNISIVEEQ